jgi:hypothetical protein
MEIMSVLEYISFLRLFFPSFVYAPLALCHPPLPVMSCTAKKTIQKGFLFSSSLLLLFSFASSSFSKSTLAFLFLFQPRRSSLFYSILLAPIHPSSIINPT